MVTYKAMVGGDCSVEYSFDAAKAWISETAGRTLRWTASDDGHSWFGYRTAQERDQAGSSGHGCFARIVDHTHPEF